MLNDSIGLTSRNRNLRTQSEDLGKSSPDPKRAIRLFGKLIVLGFQAKHRKIVLSCCLLTSALSPLPRGTAGTPGTSKYFTPGRVALPYEAKYLTVHKRRGSPLLN